MRSFILQLILSVFCFAAASAGLLGAAPYGAAYGAAPYGAAYGATYGAAYGAYAPTYGAATYGAAYAPYASYGSAYGGEFLRSIKILGKFVFFFASILLESSKKTIPTRFSLQTNPFRWRYLCYFMDK